MPGACSADLRERVLAAVEAGETASAVARRFAVGRSTVQDWVRVLRQDGRREAGRMGGHRKPAIAGEAEAALRRMLRGANHLTLAECRDRLAAEAGVSVHLMHRAPGADAHEVELEENAPCARPSSRKRGALAAGIVRTWRRHELPGTRTRRLA